MQMRRAAEDKLARQRKPPLSSARERWYLWAAARYVDQNIEKAVLPSGASVERF
jgi:hypothetical protein